MIITMEGGFRYPCKSAPSAKSAFYRTDSRTKSTEGKVSGFISVHPRFFYDVTFQTGSTGWTGYYFDTINTIQVIPLNKDIKEFENNNKSFYEDIIHITINNKNGIKQEG